MTTSQKGQTKANQGKPGQGAVCSSRSSQADATRAAQGLQFTSPANHEGVIKFQQLKNVCVDNANENENGIRLEKKVKRSRWVVVETQRRGPATSTTGEPNQRGMQLKRK